VAPGRPPRPGLFFPKKRQERGPKGGKMGVGFFLLSGPPERGRPWWGEWLAGSPKGTSPFSAWPLKASAVGQNFTRPPCGPAFKISQSSPESAPTAPARASHQLPASRWGHPSDQFGGSPARSVSWPQLRLDRGQRWCDSAVLKPQPAGPPGAPSRSCNRVLHRPALRLRPSFEQQGRSSIACANRSPRAATAPDAPNRRHW